MIVPETPEELLVGFLPRWFDEKAAAALEAESRPGTPASSSRRAPATVGVGVRVVGAGEWTVRVVARQLAVEHGIAADVALQLSLHARDFSRLVLEPLRRAASERGASPPEPGSSGGTTSADAGTRGERSAAALRAFWSRLSRWDDETVSLLKRQRGRVLLRVDDDGTSRNVAITPGSEPYSLESAECSIDCRLSDLERLETGTTNPIELFYSGQIRISGDAQIALAMAGLFL